MTTARPSLSQAVMSFVSMLENRADRGQVDLERSARNVQSGSAYPGMLPDALRCMAWGRDYRKSCDLVLDIVKDFPTEPAETRVKALVYVNYYNLPQSGNGTDGRLPRDVAVANRAANILADILDNPTQKLDPGWRMRGEMTITRTFENKTPRGRMALANIALLSRANRALGLASGQEAEMVAQFLAERKKEAPSVAAVVPVRRSAVQAPAAVQPPQPAGPRPMAVVIPFRPNPRGAGPSSSFGK